MTTRGELLQKVVRMASALAHARVVLADERKGQFECFVIHGTKDTPDAYKQMNPAERAAIRRFDRAIKKIDEALR